MQCFCPSYIKSRCRRQTLFICWGVTYALPRLSALLAVNSLQPWVARHIMASCCYIILFYFVLKLLVQCRYSHLYVLMLP